MKYLYQILTVLFALLFVISFLFNREINLESELAKKENELLKVQKDSIISVYHENYLQFKKCQESK